jgi:cephalosporin-C deacetylase-like acetyl esterase
MAYKTMHISIEDIIVIYGESLGTAISIEVISKQNHLKALILEAPFTSMIDAAKYHYPYLPVSLMLKR